MDDVAVIVPLVQDTPLEGGKTEDDRTDTERVSRWLKRKEGVMSYTLVWTIIYMSIMEPSWSERNDDVGQKGV